MESIAPEISSSNLTRLRRVGLAGLSVFCGLLLGCETTPNATAVAVDQAKNSNATNEFFIVDCLLPGQLRKLGGKHTYLTQRRPIKTAQSDCEIRGGEYVAYDRADYSTALRIWLPLAKTGDPAAQTYVGEIYEKGLGLSADYQVAAHWYTEAANQGYSRAEINLGNLYEKGLGVEQDKQRALNLYRSASGLGGDNLLYASTLSTSHVLRHDYEAVQQELAQEQQQSAQLKRRLARISDQLNKQSSILQGAEEDLRVTESRLEQALARQSTVATAVAATAPEQELQVDVEQMDDHRRDLESQIAQLRRQNSELSSSQRALVEQLSGNEKARNSYRQQIAQLERELTRSSQQLQDSEKSIAIAREKLAEQQSREPALTPQLIGLQRDLDSKNQALTEEQVKLAKLESQRKSLVNQLSATDQRMAGQQLQIDQLQGQLVAAKQHISGSEQEIASLRAELDRRRSSEAELTPALRASQRDLETKNLALAEERRKYAELVTERHSLVRQLDSSARRKADYQSESDRLQEQLASSRQALSTSEQQVAALSEQVAELQARESAMTPQLLSLRREVDAQNQALTREKVKFATLASTNQAQQRELTEALEELDARSQLLAEAESNYKREKAGLETMQVEREQQLEEIGHQLLLARAALQMERASSDQALTEQAEAHQLALQEQHGELQQLTSQLTTQLALVKSQKQQIARLQQEAQEIKREPVLVDTPPAPSPQLALADDSPSIEIIEPPVVLTRSQATVRLRTFRGERQVIGKVVAPAGLLSLSVNGHTPQLTDNNLFRSSIPLTEDPTAVEVVLVDNEGRRAAVSFSFVDQEDSLKQDAGKPIIARASYSNPRSARDVPMGDYYALVIGNNEYKNFSTLKTAVNDARETERVLREKYRFKTKLLLNADRYEMLLALNELRETLDEDDNLLIYYAGHGKLDASNELGYWLPVDAEQKNNINWISNEAITDILSAIEAKHILVVADSCYAGTLTQTPIARVQADVPDELRTEWIKVMAETRARITLTSGGVEPVLDGGGGRHSVFAKAFLDALQSNDQIMEGYSLYSRVMEIMASQSSPQVQEQIPQYAPIHLAGHESGEFFFNPT